MKSLKLFKTNDSTHPKCTSFMYHEKFSIFVSELFSVAIFVSMFPSPLARQILLDTSRSFFRYVSPTCNTVPQVIDIAHHFNIFYSDCESRKLQMPHTRDAVFSWFTTPSKTRQVLQQQEEALSVCKYSLFYVISVIVCVLACKTPETILMLLQRFQYLKLKGASYF